MKKCRWMVISLALVSGAPALGQATDDHKLSEAMLTTSRAAKPPPPLARCRGGQGGDAGTGDIVVCGTSENAQQRIPSTAASDPTSRAGLRNGELHPPQFDKGSCQGQLGCFIGGGVPPPAYIIDMKAIPEAPAGSDADRVAKGEMAQP